MLWKEAIVTEGTGWQSFHLPAVELSSMIAQISDDGLPLDTSTLLLILPC